MDGACFFVLLPVLFLMFPWTIACHSTSRAHKQLRAAVAELTVGIATFEGARHSTRNTKGKYHFEIVKKTPMENNFLISKEKGLKMRQQIPISFLIIYPAVACHLTARTLSNFASPLSRWLQASQPSDENRWKAYKCTEKFHFFILDSNIWPNFIMNSRKESRE